MLIADIYNPLLLRGQMSAEESIISAGLIREYNQLRRIIFNTKLVISPRLTKKKGEKATAALGLAPALNNAFGIALTSAGWTPLKAPGGKDTHNLVDWYKARPSEIDYGPTELGLGLEFQFGNNYQVNEDIKRLSEAFLAGKTVAGIIIVPSNILARHKADRGAFFSDAKSKLRRHLNTLYISQARKIPPIQIIGIQQDGYNDDTFGYFELTPVKLDPSSDQEKFVQTNKITNEKLIENRRKRADKG